MPYVAPGKDSTEYRKALRAEVAGFLLIVLGLGACALAIYLASPIECYVGLGLVLAGAHLVAQATSSYSASRQQAKTAPAPVHERSL